MLDDDGSHRRKSSGTGPKRPAKRSAVTGRTKPSCRGRFDLPSRAAGTMGACGSCAMDPSPTRFLGLSRPRDPCSCSHEDGDEGDIGSLGDIMRIRPSPPTPLLRCVIVVVGSTRVTPRFRCRTWPALMSILGPSLALPEAAPPPVLCSIESRASGEQGGAVTFARTFGFVLARWCRWFSRDSLV